MNLTATNAKVQLDSELVAEFNRVFAQENPAAIQWAFRKWRVEEWSFPAICQIGKRVRAWHRMKLEEAEAQRRAEERKLTEAATARGQLLEFADILKVLDEIVGKMPEPVHIQRLKAARRQEVDLITPPIHLTPEQIAVRREREKAEIERYEQNT